MSQISFFPFILSIYLVITKPLTTFVIVQFFSFEKINIIESKSSFSSSFSYSTPFHYYSFPYLTPLSHKSSSYALSTLYNSPYNAYSINKEKVPVSKIYFTGLFPITVNFFDQSFETTFQQKNILEFDSIIPFVFPWEFHRNLIWGNFKSMGREFLHFA